MKKLLIVSSLLLLFVSCEKEKSNVIQPSALELELIGEWKHDYDINFLANGDTISIAQPLCENSRIEFKSEPSEEGETFKFLFLNNTVCNDLENSWERTEIDEVKYDGNAEIRIHVLTADTLIVSKFPHFQKNYYSR